MNPMMLQALTRRPSLSGLGAASFEYCEFLGTYRYSEAAKAVQELLIAKGASGLKADGLWGPCSGTAFQNVFGEPLTKESLQRLVGVTCAKFQASPLGPCKDGSDAITPVGPGPTTQALPGGYNSQFLKNLTVTSTAPDLRTQVSVVQPPDLRTQLRMLPATGGALSKNSVVAGVPDWALGLGLVAVVAGAAYMIKKRR